MPERLRFGVIGTGAVGLQHLNSLQQSSRAVAVAIAESNASRAKQAADRYHLPRSYSNYAELLDQPDIDAITIAVPNNLHAKIALAALQSRKHVLVEAPFCLNAREAKKLVEAAKKTRRNLTVMRRLRFRPDTQASQALIKEGGIGEVYHARCFWLKRTGIPRIGSWYTQKSQSGGGCGADLGGEILDACFHLLGEFDVSTVSAHHQGRLGSRGLGEGNWGKSPIAEKRTFDVEDFAVAMLRMKSGRVVILETTWAAFHRPHGREMGIDLFGDSAGLSLFPATVFQQSSSGHTSTELSTSSPHRAEDPIHDFAANVLEGKKPLVTLDETLKVRKALDALYASAKSKKEVRLT